MGDSSRTELLRIAREAVRRELAGDPMPLESPLSITGSSGGAFVSLYRDGRLRGCMGTFSPQPSLVETIDGVARSACRDPRFTRQPVTLAELPQIRIEVSVLTPPEPTDDPASLRIGTEGILVQRGEQGGCFLPQVAVERGWKAEEFLSQCCILKAGLPADAWKQPGTDVQLFTAEVFHEREPEE